MYVLICLIIKNLEIDLQLKSIKFKISLHMKKILIIIIDMMISVIIYYNFDLWLSSILGRRLAGGLIFYQKQITGNDDNAIIH